LARESCASGGFGICWNVGFPWDQFAFVFLHFERFDAVSELDDFDSAAKTGLSHIGFDFGKQVVVGCVFTAKPGMPESLLRES
jgi:hypothetical protein